MASINDVIKTLLTEIVDAKVTSDRYVAEIAQSYRKDELLRSFPLPSVEIKNIEFDLKFAFTDSGDKGDKFKSEVVIDSDRLTKVNPNSISSIKLSIGSGGRQQVQFLGD